MKRLFLLLPYLIGFLFSLPAVYVAWNNLTVATQGLETTAVIKDIVKKSARPHTHTSGNGIVWHPILELKNVRGEFMSVSSIAAVTSGAYERGEQVNVAYILDSERVIIKDFYSIWLQPLILLGIATIFYCFGRAITRAR